jgi:hypothetical protein
MRSRVLSFEVDHRGFFFAPKDGFAETQLICRARFSFLV